MAQMIASSRTAAGNSSGTQAAACPAWRAVSRFHVGTGHTEPTQEAGYTTARNSELPQQSIWFLAIEGSPYMICKPCLFSRLLPVKRALAATGATHDYGEFIDFARRYSNLGFCNVATAFQFELVGAWHQLYRDIGNRWRGEIHINNRNSWHTPQE